MNRMVDLARQAFPTCNFNLAAEIYAQNIAENGPSADLYIGLADSYARANQLEKAFRAYSNAFRSGNVSYTKLTNLVAALVDKMTERERLKPKAPSEEGDLFTCDICTGIWNDPVTIQCGHTFCKNCLEKADIKTCKTCTVNPSYYTQLTLKTNVTLMSCMECWFPEESKASKFRDQVQHQGNALFSSGKCEEAVDVYSKALELVPTDHLLVSDRSCAYISLGKHKEALSDAALCIRLKPDWAMAYYRKGIALGAMSRHEEAAVAHLQCLTFDPAVTSARTALAKTLHTLLSPLPAEDVKMPGLLAKMSSSLGHVLGVSTLPQMEPGVVPEGDLKQGIKQRMLKQVKHHLLEDLINDGKLQPNEEEISQTDGSEQSDTSKNAIADVDNERCQSAPGSCPPSPTLQKGVWSSSASLNEEDGKLTRKRSCNSSFQSEATNADEACSMQPSKQARPSLCKCLSHGKERAHMAKDIFECSLCLRLLYNPVTTPCGHTFCMPCLDRCFDYNTSCPLCKTCLSNYIAKRSLARNEAMEVIFKKYFPNEYQKRKQQYEESLAVFVRIDDENNEIPVFVCTTTFPTVPCPLHVFEPRYRLMIRQCIESGARQFGMCSATEDNLSFTDIGTMLEIRNLQYFPDGRSVIETVGGRRFRVKARGHRDGYNTATVEFIMDLEIPTEELEGVQKLHDEVYAETKEWFASLTLSSQEAIVKNCGRFPDPEPDALRLANGPSWLWWVPTILPLNNRTQLALLSMNRLEDRLRYTRRILSVIRKKESH